MGQLQIAWLETEGPRILASPKSLCCGPWARTSTLALYWFNPGRPVPLTKIMIKIFSSDSNILFSKTKYGMYSMKQFFWVSTSVSEQLDNYLYRCQHSWTVVQSAYQKFNSLISKPKHMLWVLKRTVSMRRIFWAPKAYIKTVGQENIYNFTLKKFVYLNLWHSSLFSFDQNLYHHDTKKSPSKSSFPSVRYYIETRIRDNSC